MLAKEMRFIERFKAQAAKAAQVQSRVKKLDKIERVEPPKRRKTLDFEFPACARSGEDVAKLERVHKAYGKRVVYDGLDLAIRRKERWAIMGVNGAGKSTLLKLIAGEAAADDGTVTVGPSVRNAPWPACGKAPSSDSKIVSSPSRRSIECWAK